MSSNPAYEQDDEGGVERGKHAEAANGKAGAAGKPTVPNGTSNGGAPGSHVMAAKQKNREKKPLLYCRLVTGWPKLSFAISLCTHLSFLLITMILVQVGYDIIPIVFERIPLDITDDMDYLRGMAWTNREDAPGIVNRVGQSIQTERSAVGDIFTIFYEEEGSDANVLTVENLKLMKEVEDKLWGEKEFQKKLCFLQGGKCVKPKSLLRYFDGTYVAANPIFRDYTADGDAMFDQFQEVFYEATKNGKTKEGFEYFMGKEAEVTASKAESVITRTQWIFGLPYAGYANSTDREEEQKDVIKNYLKDVLTKEADKYYQNKVGDMIFVYSSFQWLGISIQGQVFKDMALAGGSLLFIIVFMCIQTGSLWVTCFAILSIITSFCGANIIYRCIFDYRYFGIFHVLAIFIILGIGADDVFIFFDTWKATRHHHYESLAHRLSDCYRKASMAMLFTSLTTAMAFVVSSTSPFLGIYTFGLFAAWLVIVNYISVVLFFPTVVIMYHTYFEKFKCCCCCPGPLPPPNPHPGNNVTPSGPSGPQGNDVTLESVTSKQGSIEGPVVVVTDNPHDQPMSETWDDLHSRKHPIVRFFRGPYFRLVTHRVLRWVILVLFIIMVGVFIGFATQIKVNEEQTKFLPDNTNSGRYLAKSSDSFRGTSDRATSVAIVWGLKEQDLSSCHRTDVECTGKTVWDDTFDMNSETPQKQLKNLCQYFRDLPDETIEKLHIKKNFITDVPEVDCFIDKMEEFYKEEENHMQPILPATNPLSFERRYPSGTDLKLPWTDDNVKHIIDYNQGIYDRSQLIQNNLFNDYFEIAASFWLYNGFEQGAIFEHLQEYGPLIGEAEVEGQTINTTMGTGRNKLTYTYGTRLRYMSILINTTINGRILGYPTGLPIRDAWEETVSTQIAKLDKPLQGGFQTTPGQNNLWHWLKVQKRLVTSATVGIAIGLGLAFPILVIATNNIIVGSMATLIIVIITVSVLGVIPMAGWKLGVLESLNLVLVVGLAVDYVVHLAEGYSRSEHRDRLGRLHDALEEVGISVLSGAITTLGASFFLLLAEILFFKQFGIFMFSTIGLSICYSLGLFIVLLGLFGPEDDMGNLKVMFAKLCCRRRGGAEHDELQSGNASNNANLASPESPTRVINANHSNNANATDADVESPVDSNDGSPTKVIHVQAYQPLSITFSK